MATPVIMPRQGQSVESCILVEWSVGPGDQVSSGDTLAQIETDKAVFEVEAPAGGTVLELFFEAGADIPVLTHIAAIGEAGEDVSTLRPSTGEVPAEASADTPASPETVPAPEAAALPPAGEARGVSPRARNLAAGAGVPVASLPGSGPGGRVIERDVQAALERGPRLSPTARAAAVGPAPAVGSGPAGLVLEADLHSAPESATSLSPAVEEQPVDGIRRIIAERMHQSLATTAQLTLQRSFDASAIQAYRARVKSHGESLGLPNITINDLIAYATIRTLMKHPALNAHWLGDRIARFGAVHLGIAMDTPRGLMVPVVPGASAMSLSALSGAIKPLVEAAKSGSINPDLLRGGTFTVTNLGVLGIESFTPILNTPEVGILGVGGLYLKPVQGDDGIVHVPAINLCLTLDHQAVDGADGARFLQELARTLEHFDLSLAG